MRIATTAAAMIIAAVASSSVASAAEVRLSDSQFIKAAKCRALPGAEGEKATAVYNANRRGRATHVLDAADSAGRAAALAPRGPAARAGAEAATKLAEECAAIIS